MIKLLGLRPGPCGDVCFGSVEGRSILIVEDEPLIALDIAQAFEPTGASIITTETVAQALALIDRDDLSGAILDHGLPDGDSGELCGRLKERGVPFFIYSGYREATGACEDALHISKPAPDRTLVSAMVRLIGAAERPAPS